MNDKQERILHSAMNLFANKGYHFTSMQEIAEDVGISKGSLYLNFKSKEELLLSIIKRYQDEMFEKLAFVSKDTYLSPFENLTKQVFIHLSLFKENGDFIKILLNEQRNQKSINIQDFISQTRAKIIFRQKKMLLQAYGEEINPFLWDLVSIFHGIIREYQHQLVFERKPLDIQETASFIVRLTKIITEDFNAHQPTPIITAEMMMEIDQLGEHESFHSQEEKLSFDITQLIRKIELLHIPNAEEKHNYISSLLLLDEEMKSKQPRKFLINSLLAYIHSIKELEEDVTKLKEFIDLMSKKRLNH
ncbi:TetR/AcrR family transcriptional regulator [Bacillus solitudinis]|uniref:TetR/AcrR family transcriptional regulator n=1 Tax=Bacillus solitudinis TaxID=2014074 RepID=UPI000C23370F|nr:TetR/AcrR family transcriptional regulator [Bacillus solitudinis]